MCLLDKEHLNYAIHFRHIMQHKLVVLIPSFPSCHFSERRSPKQFWNLWKVPDFRPTVLGSSEVWTESPGLNQAFHFVLLFDEWAKVWVSLQVQTDIIVLDSHILRLSVFIALRPQKRIRNKQMWVMNDVINQNHPAFSTMTFSPEVFSVNNLPPPLPLSVSQAYISVPKVDVQMPNCWAVKPDHLPTCRYTEKSHTENVTHMHAHTS